MPICISTLSFFFFNATPTTEIYTLSLHDALPISNLEFCAANFDRRFFRYIQLDDGYQKATGDWDTNAKFPHGHRWLTDQIHAKGFKAGLWLAPFAVTERSGIPAAHPEWLLRRADAPIVWDTRDDWGGKVYSLDGAHPQVQQWLFDLARRAVQTWGYDYRSEEHRSELQSRGHLVCRLLLEKKK